MKAVILAAGYATRLYPLTENQPKCLLEVAGKTILDHLILKFSALKEVDEIVLVTNAKFYNLLTTWSQKAKSLVPITVLNDGTTSNDNRLGAIGDLNFALKSFKKEEDIVLFASDNLFDEGLEGFYQLIQKDRESVVIGVYDIGDPMKASKKYGVAIVDKNNKVTALEEKPERPNSSLVGMGVYYFPKKVLAAIPGYLKSPDAKDAPGYFVHWMMSRFPIYAFIFKGMWYDIGDLESLEYANRNFQTKK